MRRPAECALGARLAPAGQSEAWPDERRATPAEAAVHGDAVGSRRGEARHGGHQPQQQKQMGCLRPFGNSGDGGEKKGADVRFHGVPPLGKRLVYRLHWRKRFGTGKWANQLKNYFGFCLKGGSRSIENLNHNRHKFDNQISAAQVQSAHQGKKFLDSRSLSITKGSLGPGFATATEL
jgi:hypothetical protein